jgi:hypothetical protein
LLNISVLEQEGAAAINEKKVRKQVKKYPFSREEGHFVALPTLEGPKPKPPRRLSTASAAPGRSRNGFTRFDLLSLHDFEGLGSGCRWPSPMPGPLFAADRTLASNLWSPEKVIFFHRAKKIHFFFFSDCMMSHDTDVCTSEAISIVEIEKKRWLQSTLFRCSFVMS